MNINLKVTDESNNSLTQSFVIYVNDLNRAPTDIGISSTTFLEAFLLVQLLLLYLLLTLIQVIHFFLINGDDPMTLIIQVLPAAPV